MMWLFLLTVTVTFMVVGVVAIRSWGAIVLRRLELEAQYRQAELMQRYVAGELNPAPLMLGPSIDEIRKVVEKATWEATSDAGEWVALTRGYKKTGRPF